MPVGVSAYVPLANVTLGASASSVLFSSINQGYRDLVVIIAGVHTSATPSLRFNGVTSNIYDILTMEGNGSSTVTLSITGTSLGFSSGSLGSTGAQCISIANIMDYSATDKHKTVVGRANNAAVMTSAFAGRWPNTAAITTVTVLTGNGNPYETGTSFALYGIAS